MQGPRLESVVNPYVPRLRRLRRRLVFATGFLIGAGAVAAIALDGGRPRTTTVAVPHPVAYVVTVESPAAPPEPPPPPTPEEVLGCEPVAVDADEPVVGAAVRTERLPVEHYYNGADSPKLRVHAAAAAPQVAVWRYDRTVWVSDDDGAKFRQAFADHDVSHVAVDSTGVIYALAAPLLGVRATDGVVRWRRAGFGACTADQCSDQLALLADRPVWFHDDAVATTADHGRSWQVIERDSTWQEFDDDIDLFTWRGAVYAVDHYTDRCGVDDTPVNRFDGSRVDYTIFHDYFVPGEAVLRADDPVATTWQWRERCWLEPGKHEDDVEQLGRCKHAPASRTAMLIASTLRPKTGGGRTLGVWDGSLVELCEQGARQVYRDFPYVRVEAADARGRPVVVVNDTVLRFSFVHGWRRLYRIPEPESAGAPFALE